MSDATTFPLTEDRIPTHWVNLLPDLPGDPLPPLNPQTKEPAGPQDLTPIFPMALIEQEVSPAPEIEIPEEDRKSTRLNSSHANISYAVFCLKKKNKIII